ncbi:hypothetical protein PHPALM_27904 [Phytophthora palmivora]|uniref:Uncharacterized protein n=1 Tax=Phytophthora palmivora TaxID=4796 RepID=A0A2P4XBI9_9STRA|nr:hypothetical protein PHPALM_27904 [Phytophthora palmivora]
MSFLAAFVASRWLHRTSGPRQPKGGYYRILEDLFAFIPHLWRCLPTISPSRFQWLSTLFRTLGDVPVGNYLLRQHDAAGQSTFGKKRGGVEVLMATFEPGIESVGRGLFTTSEQQTQSFTISDSIVLRHSVSPSWNLRDRIPYTYQTGIHKVNRASDNNYQCSFECTRQPHYHVLGDEEHLTTSEIWCFQMNLWFCGDSTVPVSLFNPMENTDTSYRVYLTMGILPTISISAVENLKVKYERVRLNSTILSSIPTAHLLMGHFLMEFAGSAPSTTGLRNQGNGE